MLLAAGRVQRRAPNPTPCCVWETAALAEVLAEHRTLQKSCSPLAGLFGVQVSGVPGWAAHMLRPMKQLPGTRKRAYCCHNYFSPQGRGSCCLQAQDRKHWPCIRPGRSNSSWKCREARSRRRAESESSTHGASLQQEHFIRMELMHLNDCAILSSCRLWSFRFYSTDTRLTLLLCKIKHFNENMIGKVGILFGSLPLLELKLRTQGFSYKAGCQPRLLGQHGQGSDPFPIMNLKIHTSEMFRSCELGF